MAHPAGLTVLGEQKLSSKALYSFKISKFDLRSILKSPATIGVSHVGIVASK